MASFTVDAARNGAPAAALPHARPVTRSRTAIPVRPAWLRAKASAAGPRTARSSGPAAGVAAVPGRGGGGPGGGRRSGRGRRWAPPPGRSRRAAPRPRAFPRASAPGQRASRPPDPARPPVRFGGWARRLVPGRGAEPPVLHRRGAPVAGRALRRPPPHAAALVGDGSDVLGRDTPMSTDHGWGPAVTLFLPEAAAGRAPAIRALLTERLPRASWASRPGSRPSGPTRAPCRWRPAGRRPGCRRLRCARSPAGSSAGTDRPAGAGRLAVDGRPAAARSPPARCSTTGRAS